MQHLTVDKFAEVFQMLQFHFAHKQEYLKQYFVATPEDLHPSFLAFASQRKDHLRMLSLAAREMLRVAQAQIWVSGGQCEADTGIVMI